MEIVFVVAVARNGVIGRGNALPWRIKSDLAHFRRLTLDRPVIMGRRTFQSIGKALAGRTNIVVSRDPGFCAPGIVVSGDLDRALAAGRGDALRRGADEIAVIGGAALFSMLLAKASRIEFTHVHAEPEGDVLFPPLDQTIWVETARRHQSASPEDEYAVSFLTFRRRCAANADP